MKLGQKEILTSVLDVLYDLKSELAERNIDLLQDIKDGPDNVMITCPYHNEGHERKPSMGVKKSNGICHCFACGKVVDLSELIDYCLGVNGKQWLAEHYDAIEYEKVQSMFADLDKSRSKDADNILIQKIKGTYVEEKEYVPEEELDKYRWTHPYWAKRGITEDWVTELFDLGYDREKQMITFPVRDEHGNCEFVAKRSVNIKFFRYPEGVSKPLYGLYELYKDSSEGECSSKTHNLGYPFSFPKEILVCESMIDCILLWQSHHYAVALNGLGNERQFKQLRELPVRHLVLATDNDEAGQKARQRIRSNINNKLISEIRFPDGIKDIGECSREQVANILDWEVWGWERL